MEEQKNKNFFNIIFYGPIAGKSGNIGGGESGNKKTLEILSRLGGKVSIIKKPSPLNIPFIGKIFFVFQIFYSYLKLIILIIETESPKIFHISGFYQHLIYIEYIFVLTARLFRINVIYELRAGGIKESYLSRSKLYRWFFNATVKKATTILCQGEGDLTFIKSLTNSQVFYYPNYILNKFYLDYDSNNRTVNKRIELIYFGRLTKSKNIEFIIETFKVLKDKGIDCFLTIIGKGDPKYLSKLNQLTKSYGLSEYIEVHGPMKSKEIFSILQSKHFFIFPTIEKREGHSNSLTEAMSYGVIPIASNAGFNESIIPIEDLVIYEFNPELYANKIIHIWNEKLWDRYSRRVHKKIGDSFTEKNVTETLITAYRTGKNN